MKNPELRVIALLSWIAAAAASDGLCTAPPQDWDAQSRAPQDTGCGSDASLPPQPAPLPGLIDISVAIGPGTPIWKEAEGLPADFKWLAWDMANGDMAYDSHFKLGVHVGTHIDAPAHTSQAAFEAGQMTSQIPLEVLVGASLVLHVPDDVTQITAAVAASLGIPHDCERLLLRTSNTDRRLMAQPGWTPDFVALTTDGAQWLAEYTSVKLLGVDYMSVAVPDEAVAVHNTLFGQGITPVEGLDLAGTEHGRWYHLTCLPLKLQGTEGAPARCVLWGPDQAHEDWRDSQLANDSYAGDAAEWANESDDWTGLGDEDLDDLEDY